MINICPIGKDVIERYCYCHPIPNALNRLSESMETLYGRKRNKHLGLEIQFVQQFSPTGKKLLSEIKLMIMSDYGIREYSLRKEFTTPDKPIYAITYPEKEEVSINVFLRNSYKQEAVQQIIDGLNNFFTDPDAIELWAYAIARLNY